MKNKAVRIILVLFLIAIFVTMIRPAHADTETTVRIYEYVDGKELFVKEAAFDRFKLATFYCADEVAKLAESDPKYVCVYTCAGRALESYYGAIEDKGLETRLLSNWDIPDWPDCWMYCSEDVTGDDAIIIFER